jgi:hypothetical protein
MHVTANIEILQSFLFWIEKYLLPGIPVVLLISKIQSVTDRRTDTVNYI